MIRAFWSEPQVLTDLLTYLLIYFLTGPVLLAFDSSTATYPKWRYSMGLILGLIGSLGTVWHTQKLERVAYATCIGPEARQVSHNIIFTTAGLTSRTFRTLVTLHLLQSHCTKGLQHPKQSDRRLTGSILLPGFDTEHRWRPWYLK